MKNGILIFKYTITSILLFSMMFYLVPQTQYSGMAAYSTNTLVPSHIEGKDGKNSEMINDSHWDEQFNNLSGINGIVNAFTVDEFGNLYVGGYFGISGNDFIANIAKWNGTVWTALATGTNGPVFTLEYDGLGNIYAGGEFTTAGSQAANRIAKWDGTNWFALGDGFTQPVTALAWDNLGNLYAGGSFTQTYNHISMWNGNAWLPLGSGVNGTVNTLENDTDGGIFVGGDFTHAGGVDANNIAYWDGNSWTMLDNGTDDIVRSITRNSNGDIYVGGDFHFASGVNVNHIAQWDGSSWHALGSGLDEPINSLVFNDTGDLFVGGNFTHAGDIEANHIARWDGINWSQPGDGLNDNVFAVEYILNSLFAGGIFSKSGEINANSIAEWEGNNWKSLVNGVNNSIYDLKIDELGNLYTGGTFSFAGGGISERVARWNGVGWSALDSGLNSTVHALSIDFLGDLYAGGAFTMAGDLIVNHIAHWDGTQWSPLGSGTNNTVLTIAIDGNGNVFVGGLFTTAGDVETNHIAKWNGSLWEPLGEGLNGGVGTIAIAENGDIYVGGDFSMAGGVPASNIARWDGNDWFAVGTGMNHRVDSIVINGDELYAGGLFTSAGGNLVNYITKWDGLNWSALGIGMNAEVHSLAVNGIGNIIAGGEFTTAGGVEANHVAIWDGTSWSTLGSGLNDTVLALDVGDIDFYAGGAFTSAGNKPSYHIARWYNSAPMAIGDSFDTGEDQQLNIPAPGVLNNDLDPEDDPLLAIVVDEPAHGSLNLSSDGSFYYQPDLNYYGSDLFEYAASDRFLTDSATVIISINPINDPPVLDPIGNQLINEGSILQFTATANDVDNPQEDLVYSLDPGAPNGSSITPDGDFSWLPDESQGPGIYSVTIRVTDNGVPPLSDFETISITVDEVNSQPTINPIDDQFIDEGSLLSLTVSATDEDIPANDLIFSLDPGSPSGASITPDGVFTWTPQENQGPGIYEIVVRVTDDGIPPLSDFDSFSVIVSDINQPPIAIDDFYIAEINTPLEIAPPGVLINDVDEDLPPNPLIAIVMSNPTHGLIEFNQDGSFVYMPEPDYLGFDDFTYSVDDGFEKSNIATVTISVTLGNEAPIVFAGVDMSGDEGSEMSFSGSFIDPGLLSDILSGELIRWDFGDGSQITGTLTPTHIYSDNGVFQTTLTVTDTMGGVGTDTLAVTSSNVFPSIDEQPDRYLSIGMIFNLAAHFSDPGSMDTHSGILNWGDGTVELAIINQDSNAMIGSHNYLLAGSYNVSLTIIDDDGGQTQTNFQIFVSGHQNYLPLINKD